MRSSIILALALFAGCAETEYTGAQVGGKSVHKALCPTGCSDDVERVLGSGEQFEPIDDNIFSTVGELGAANVCDVLPAGGICADVCDLDALKQHAPAGSCIDFTCTLSDGRQIVGGVCALD